MSPAPEYAPAHVTVVNEFPEDLYDAMRGFVRTHPNWDQYRLMQVALAGFLFQQGSRERAVARHYLDGLFDRGSGAPVAAGPEQAPQPTGVAAEASQVPSPVELPSPSRIDSAVPARQQPIPLRPRSDAPAVASLRSPGQPLPHHPGGTQVSSRAA